MVDSCILPPEFSGEVHPATEAVLEQAEPTKMAEAGKGESGRSTCSQIYIYIHICT